ncbi:MAG: alpha/beta hydrolase [Candidatus Lokiarchaeota archaeon]|nr:alpha/beta hydrolase [Candidatus Lokiarchaeota archaeon]
MVSMFANMIMKKMEVQKDFIFDMKNVKEFRVEFEKMFLKMKPAKGIALEEIRIGNISAEKYSNSEDSNSRVMLYLHGGGYFSGSYMSHRRFVSILCKKLHLNAYSINYRLAPEDPYPAGLDDAFYAYKWLLEEESIPAESIIIMGDSAGGGLALSLLYRIRIQNIPQPKAVICLSPWTDMSLTSETIKTKVDEDVFFNLKNLATSAIAYYQKESPENPEISPIFADFNGFPPIFIQVGTREMLLNDSLIIAEKMKNQGVSVTVDMWEGMFHAFLIFAAIPIIGKMTPEFKKALKNVQKFVESLEMV